MPKALWQAYFLKDSLLASSLPISTQTVCYQDSSRRIALTTQRRPLCWRSWRTFFLQSAHEICLPLFCWTYRRPSTRSIMVFFCIDKTLPIRSWNQWFQSYLSNRLQLLPHRPAPWCVVYPRVPFLVPYFSFCTAVTCSRSLRAMESARWWSKDLRFMSSICIPGAAITHLNVYWSCHWVDAFKSPPT